MMKPRNIFSRRSRRLENCRNGSTLDRDKRHHIAVEPALARVRFHRLAHEIGQAGKLGLVFELQRERLLVGEHVLAERGAERREPFDDLGEPLLGRRVKRGAGAAEAGMIALDDALLLGGEPKRAGVAHQRVDALEQQPHWY